MSKGDLGRQILASLLSLADFGEDSDSLQGSGDAWENFKWLVVAVIFFMFFCQGDLAKNPTLTSPNFLLYLETLWAKVNPQRVTFI